MDRFLPVFPTAWLPGVSTIRAYGLGKHFSNGVRVAIDNMNAAYYITFANQRWLSVRLDVIGNILVFCTGILVVTSRFSVNPSIGGLVLSYILGIVQMIQFTVRQLAEVENDMNATERIHFYATNLDEEAPRVQRKEPSTPRSAPPSAPNAPRISVYPNHPDLVPPLPRGLEPRGESTERTRQRLPLRGRGGVALLPSLGKVEGQRGRVLLDRI